MRLIDADKLLSYIDRVKNSGLGKQKTIEYITKYISNMPTAFDVDKVVVQLEESYFITESTFDDDGWCNDDSEEVVNLNEAIEIVKRGGIDENKKDN